MEQIYEPVSLDTCCVEATYLLLVTPGIVLIIIVSHVVNRKVSPTNLLLPAEPPRLDGAGQSSIFMRGYEKSIYKPGYLLIKRDSSQLFVT
jgi:hypothetical protein